VGSRWELTPTEGYVLRVDSVPQGPTGRTPPLKVASWVCRLWFSDSLSMYRIAVLVTLQANG
jgi:hypothetical protein